MSLIKSFRQIIRLMLVCFVTTIFVYQGNAQSGRPYVVFVNGYQNCCAWSMDKLQKKLRELNAEFRFVPYSNFEENGKSGDLSNDTTFLREGADFINFKLDKNRPLILIGHSYGGDSILSLLQMINRRVQFVAVIDPVGTAGFRKNIKFGAPSNVDFFYNRWQENGLGGSNVVPFDSRVTSGTLSCAAKVCSQKAQNISRRADYSPYKENCPRLDPTCWGKYQKRTEHNSMPKDGFIQRELGDLIAKQLSKYNSVNEAKNEVEEAYIFFNKAGNNYISYNETTHKWHPNGTVNISSWGGGGTPFTQIGAVVEYHDRPAYILFNKDITKFTYYFEDTKKWGNVYDFAEFGGGGCPLSEIGTVTRFTEGNSYLFFNKAGNKYTKYDADTKKWGRVYDISEWGGGGCPFTAIGSVVRYHDRPGYILFNASGTQYTFYFEDTKEWGDVIDVTDLGGGDVPFSSVGAMVWKIK